MKRFGVAFDIDGVLTRAPRAIAGAKEALELLQAARVPFCLMTNGGGSAEHVKAKQISELLGLRATQPLRPEQICLAHTPMRGLVATLKDKPVLLVGKHYPKIKQIAAEYGFGRAVTVEELHARFPQLYPDIPPPTAAADAVAAHLAAHEGLWGTCEVAGPSSAGVVGEGFAAVLVFTDPIEWGRELQLVMDVLTAPRGLVAAQPLSTGGSSEGAFPVLHTACSDVLYAAQWHAPRYGAGAFRLSLEHLWRESGPAQRMLPQTIYGKPFPAQYRYVEAMLARIAADGGRDGGRDEGADGGEEGVKAAPSDEGGAVAVCPPPSGTSSLERFYMVGDNPLTDIRGARNAGSKWRAILTRTGLWQGGDNDETDPADAVVANVLEGVRWIIAREQEEEGARAEAEGT